MVTSLAIVIMFSGLLFIHMDKFNVALAIMIGGAAMFVGSLYAWLTSPLE